jgi:hypothetical protein
MSKIISTLIFLLSSPSIFGQISGMWHSSNYDMPFTEYSMKLKGHAKSWTMAKSTGETRTITFDKIGNIISDTYSGTLQSFIPPDFMLYKLKNDLEKSHSVTEKENSSCIYNNKMQLVERLDKNYLERNLFDHQGKILIHQRTHTTTETRAWNSLHGHQEPTYTYHVKTGILAFFKYNSQGRLKEISYFHSDPFENLRMVYVYDENNNLIATNRYDNYNRGVHNMPDNYLDTIMKSEIDTNFSIDAFYPNYWGVGSPAVNKWKYDTNGLKIEYNAYGYKPNGGAAIISFISKWEYDEHGILIKEIHFDVWKNRISKIFEFDRLGNVIKETQLGYEEKNDIISEMTIDYY